MKKLLAVIAVLCLGACVWFGYEQTKPEILAKIEITPTTVVITNANGKPWVRPRIILNEAFGGHELAFSDNWPAGERVELLLSRFVRPLNKQAFNPEVQRVTEVIITAEGMQLGSFSR